MIRSMTGYGKAETMLESGKITVEIRSLNGKTADISILINFEKDFLIVIIKHTSKKLLKHITLSLNIFITLS